jgi:polysaccharide pyruvyl transferase WcaK-like protein
MGSCHFVVGQRLHCTVLACALGVPNLSLSYQPKCLDFLESIHREDLSVSTRVVTSDGLIERFEWLCSEASRLTMEIARAIGALQAKQKQRADRLITDFVR